MSTTTTNQRAGIPLPNAKNIRQPTSSRSIWHTSVHSVRMKYSIWTGGWLKALSLGDLFSQLLPQGLSPLQHFLFTSLSPEPKHDVTNGFGVWHLSSVAVTQSLSTFFCDVVVKSLLSDSHSSFGGAADLLTGQPPLQTAKVTTSFPCGTSGFFFFPAEI